MIIPVVPTSQRQGTALEQILRERVHQDATFGVQDHDLAYWNVILTEQVGQMSQAVCDMRWGGKTDAAVRHQAVQVAAVALAIIECIDRGEYADDITTAKPSDARQLNIALDRGHEAINYDKDEEVK